MSIAHCFVVQARVIWALIMRELHTRYGRENLGYLWMVGEPILFCAGVAIVWTAIRPAHEHGLPMTAYVITGYVPLTMWRHCVGRGVKAFEANGSLLFHRQVTPLDIILSRATLEIVGAIMAGLIVTVCAIALGFMDPPKNLALIYMGLAYHAAYCTASALLVASLSERSDIVEKVLSIFTYLLLPISGAFIMVNWVPQQVQWVLLLSPSVHSTEMIRAGAFGPQAHAIYSVGFATWSNAVLLLIGVSLTMRSRPYILVQ